MSVPRTDQEIVADLISLCQEQRIKPADGSYKIDAAVCTEYLMEKYKETKEIIICIFINLAKDGYIRAVRGERGEVVLVLDKDL